MFKFFCLSFLILLVACSTERVDANDENKMPNAQAHMTKLSMTDEHALAKRKLFLQNEYHSSDAPTENRIVDVANFPKSPVHFSGHVLLVLGQYTKNGRKYLREALGDSDILIDFSTGSPRISGRATNFVLIESEYTGNFRSRNVELKSTKILATAKGVLRGIGSFGPVHMSFHYYGQFEIYERYFKVADASVQSTATDVFIFRTDHGDLAASVLFRTNISSVLPAFSGAGLKAIAIGQSAAYH